MGKAEFFLGSTRGAGETSSEVEIMLNSCRTLE